MSARINRSMLQTARAEWNKINEAVLPEAERKGFHQRCQAVDMYIDGASLHQIQEATGLKSPQILYLVHACLRKDEQNHYLGYRALLRGRQAMPRMSKWEKVFRAHPELREFLEGCLSGDRRFTLEHNMLVSHIHDRLLKRCLKSGIQDYEFPFNTADNGYRSLTRYVRKLRGKRADLGLEDTGPDQKRKFYSTGFGSSHYLLPVTPFECVQLDGHRLDILYTVQAENAEGELVPMTATRAWLLAVIDVSTRAILGYALTQRENYDQSDVLRALRDAVIPHRPMEFIRHPELGYPEQGGFASDCLPETRWARFSMVMLDNAKAHLADNVVSKICGTLKTVVQFGSVATPETRGIVERFFGTLEQGGLHRLPGTTGSNASDPRRRCPEEEAVRCGMDFRDIEEIVEYLIACYNRSAHEGLENRSPLQCMEEKIRAGFIPASTRDQDAVRRLTHFQEWRTLRGGYKDGRRPYFSYKGVEYHALDVPLDMDLAGQKVCLEIDPDDISLINIYDEHGGQLSTMVASGAWGRQPHSLRTRALALKRIRENRRQNRPFVPDLSAIEEELRRRQGRRGRTQADIMQRESKQKEKAKPKPDVVRQEVAQGFSEAQLAAMRKYGVVEAYRRGLME